MKFKKIILILLAIIIGFIFSLENILPYAWTKNNPDKVYTIFNGGDENLYAAEIREVYEGKLFSGDAFIYENRLKPPFTQWLGLLLMGRLAKILNSLPLVHLLGDFFFPAAIFLLIFTFVKKITKQYWGAVVTALATIFLSQLTTKLPPITPSLWQGFVDTLTLKQPIIFGFSRLVTRQFSFTLFLLFIISLYQTLKKEKFFWSISCGILSGLLIYTYIYYWTAAVVILGVSFLSRRNKAIFWAGLISLAVSSYFLLPYLSGGLIDRQIAEGRIDGRFFEPLTTWRYGLTAVLAFFAVKQKPLRTLLLSIFLAAVILMNLQLILGYTVDPGHWPNAVFEPLMIIAVGLWFFSNYHNFNRYIGVLIFPILLYAVANQVAVAKEYLPTHQLSLDEEQLFNWLNQNSRPDTVVLTLDKRLNRYIPALTHNYIYLPYATLTQLSLDQIWERVDLAFSIYNLTAAEMKNKLLETQFVGQVFEQTYNYINIEDLTGLDFPSSVRQRISQSKPVFSLGVRYIPDNIKNQQIQRAMNLEASSLKSRLCQNRLDYILVLKKERGLAGEIIDRGMGRLVLDNNSFSLYQIEPRLCSGPST